MKPSSSFICLAVLASPAWTAPIEAHAGNRASSLHERQTNKPMVPDAVQVAARDGDRRPVSESRYANALKKMGEKMWRNPLKTGL
ncbi:hypothetical protein IE81DRAFT_323457 [Ceraceosorus guamensis]|uniref:Uncharacterized protein n=1 Tax=Ceraceosorus guamensis TaxID=1522189 RepID=A0A316W040_9BASI|nr:hypothetical protein IE81DRAFT_323457 [Ceraceosorus guamensis]PWN42488.1 hypothetical protein IE81DRAFT_323457 [Ceraceosorus guamensis]